LGGVRLRGGGGVVGVGDALFGLAAARGFDRACQGDDAARGYALGQGRELFAEQGHRVGLWLGIGIGIGVGGAVAASPAMGRLGLMGFRGRARAGFGSGPRVEGGLAVLAFGARGVHGLVVASIRVGA
jgi:hypothetical protein